MYSSYGPKNHVHKLSLHLYTLSTLKEPAPELCELFLQLSAITQWGNARNYWPRVDVYSMPLSSLEECMQHHRLEKEFRKSNGGPHIVPNWSRRKSCSGRLYRNVIFVIDRDSGDWQAVLKRGLFAVQYDLGTSAEDQFEVLEAEDLGDPRDEGLVEVNPVPVDPRIERVIISREKEEEMMREQRSNWASGNIATTYPQKLYDIWWDMTMALYECTYREPKCDGCLDDFAHTDCAIEQ